MTEDELNGLVSVVDGIFASAWCDSSGIVEGRSSGFDADVPCAVAAVSSSQLQELGKSLKAGPLLDWAITTSTTNVYVVHRGAAALVAVGPSDDKAPTTAEKIALALKV